jgi:hypothetical protein
MHEAELASSCSDVSRPSMHSLSGSVSMLGVARGTMLVMPNPNSGNRSSSSKVTA